MYLVHRMLKELMSWALLGAFVLGTSAQAVTKNEDGILVFPPTPQTCEYTVTEQLNETVKSAIFGNIATGVIHSVAPATLNDYVAVVQEILENPTQATQDPAQLGTFFAGITILFLFGLFLAFIVPLIGCCFCCCRCCDNCGGRRLQKTEDNTLCKRGLFAFILLTVSLILGVGCASVYLGATTLVASPDTLSSTVLAMTDDLECYINESLSGQFEFLVNVSATSAVDLAVEEINGLSSSVDSWLQEAEEVIDTVKRLDAIAKAVNSSLHQVTAIQNEEQVLKMSLDKFVTDYNETLYSDDCGNNGACRNARSNFNRDEFSVNSDVVSQVDLDSVQSSLANILDEDLSAKAEELRSQLEPIREFIDTNSFDPSDFDSSDFNTGLTDPITSGFSEAFEVIRLAFQDDVVSDAVNQSSQYGFIGAAVFAGMIGIIVVFYTVGIIFGEIGRNRHDEPTNRDCLANCGGCMLVTGWVLSLLLYFLIAILAAFFFLFGSMGEKFICQPLSDPSSLSVIQDLLLEEMPADPAIGNLSSINFEMALRNCEENQGIWTALNLDELFGAEFDDIFSVFESELNISAILGDFNFDESVNFDVEPLKNLTNVNFNVINFTTIMAELEKPFPSLEPQISNIRDLVLAVSGSLSAELTRHANELEKIQNEELRPLQNDVDNLKMELPTLEQNITELQDETGQLVTQVELLLNRAKRTLQEVEDLGTTLSSFVDQTLNHVKTEIKTNVGRCRPLFNLYDSIDYIVCDNIFDSLNSIWLGFGIAVIFFIFGVIFAVKLSKFYRRMLYQDEYSSAGNHDYAVPNGDPYVGKNYPV